LFKQRFFSWFDSYDIYNESGEPVYSVKGKLAWGHCLRIYDCGGTHVGTVREKVLSLLPRFEIYQGDQMIGSVRKELTLIRPKFNIDYNGWKVNGNWMEWDYTVTNPSGQTVAVISKELLRLTDTYVLDIADPQNALDVLMLALALDAEKCSRSGAMNGVDTFPGGPA